MANIRTFGSSLATTGSNLLGMVDTVASAAKLTDNFIQRKLHEQTETGKARAEDNIDAVITSCTLAAAKRRLEVDEFGAKSAAHRQSLYQAAETLSGGGKSLLEQLLADAETRAAQPVTASS